MATKRGTAVKGLSVSMLTVSLHLLLEKKLFCFQVRLADYPNINLGNIWPFELVCGLQGSQVYDKSRL